MLGERLRTLRIDNNKTREEVATYLGVTVDAYGRYESETRQASIESYVKLAIYYQVSLDYLLCRDDVQTSVFNRSQVYSFRELVDLGLNGQLAHGLIKQVIDKQPFEKRIFVEGSTVKYVLKEDVLNLLEKLIEEL
ncbi:helix-turn-helix domain-containing protein [Streptococcus suis]|uniref:helix-turn-helix domain-containing protein n=1 Tax=Streptococcus suis TaxID=1307 RepID=UPI00192D74D7|nr:helix-turn-helix transcriptional regulator [Streptococcus suis]MBL6504351.1 helix-turn-helix transcriptional regulator [Streptococcus suis]MBM0241968.1 helix-turn-helix transcriptional regulator [Streptococcus suis]MBM7205095.1 helix-turn-helix transcriptional regulator [Streptococcus suis]MBM7282464.1 helix-turn-helix transcriptional regulator [Streptococcus suis]MBO4135981.1 helix-turn-helix transcriptional regulator [Streptococcus suis]